MIFLWRWIKYIFFNSIPRYRMTRDVKSRLENDFQASGKIMTTDMYNQKAVTFVRSGIVGIPDLTMIVKNKGKKYCLVGERKGRNYRGSVRQHEMNQVQLYMYMLTIYQPYPVIGRIAYNDKVIDVTFDSVLVKNIIGHKGDCLRALKTI